MSSLFSASASESGGDGSGCCDVKCCDGSDKTGMSFGSCESVGRERIVATVRSKQIVSLTNRWRRRRQKVLVKSQANSTTKKEQDEKKRMKKNATSNKLSRLSPTTCSSSSSSLPPPPPYSSPFNCQLLPNIEFNLQLSPQSSRRRRRRRIKRSGGNITKLAPTDLFLVTTMPSIKSATRKLLFYLCITLAVLNNCSNGQASSSGEPLGQSPSGASDLISDRTESGAGRNLGDNYHGSFGSTKQQNSDSITVLPPFAPTRRPLSPLSSVHYSPTANSRQQQQQQRGHKQDSMPFKPLKMSTGDNRDDSEENILHSSASVISGSSLPLSRAGGEPSSSDIDDHKSTQFSRINELDHFLDDMNHNELRTVASGRPIDDFFHPKPFHAATPASSSSSGPGSIPLASHDHQHQPASSSQQQQQQHQGRRSTSDNSNQQLIESQSGQHQQIYSECALILQRTYVKNIDDPKHQLVPFGKTEQACISYKHIDKAVEQAKHKLKFREFAKMRKKPIVLETGGSSDSMKPPLAPLDTIHSSLEPPEDLVAAIGELNMATTQIIADQFDLSNDELLNGLPLIDMSKTKFWDLCPLFVKQNLNCEITRFRTFTGHCNNIKHPTWGAARTPYARYLPPVHPDGIWVARKSIVSEITFDLGIGHREMHATIGRPSMPTMPGIDSEHNGFDNLPPPLADLHRTGSAPLPTSTTTTTTSSSIDDLIKHADNELGEDSGTSKADAGDAAASGDSDLASASSVHFVRRTAMGGVGLDRMHLPAALHEHHNSHELLIASSPSIGQPMHSSPAAAASALSLHQHHHQHNSRPIHQELPSARLVSSIVHRDMDVPSHEFTSLFASWGQLLDHDMTRAAQPPQSIKCCPQANGEQPAKHKLCLPIEVPRNDPFYSKFNVQCLEFRRTLAGVRPNCVLGPRVHQNANTAPIDANFVYGSSQAMANALRLFKGGRLRDRDWFHREGLKPLLPAQEIDPDLACLGRPRDLFCFLAGDVRVNEQTHLTVLHTLYMREHNRLADKLSELNPHWDDERTFQEARHIVAAGVQHVLINEYIPLLIGRKMSELYNLTAQPYLPNAQNHDHHMHTDHDPQQHHHHHHHHRHHHHLTGASMEQQAQYSYWNGYDPSVTTSVSNSFAAAAFRQGHTFVQSTIDRFNKYHEFVSSEKLRHLFMQPFLLYQPGVVDELVGGLINKQSQSYDPFITEELAGHLFQPPEAEFGQDLAAINLQRGREQGLPGYNLFREWCGLPRAETFEQLAPYLTNHTAYQYSRIYKHVDDIDLWSGGISERKLPGAAIGPTFACIIARQFSNTRRGDRFWYENPGLPSSFTPDQLAEIRKTTLAKLLCTNADDMPTIQRWAFRLAHPILNPRVDCNQLLDIDLQYWQEE